MSVKTIFLLCLLIYVTTGRTIAQPEIMYKYVKIDTTKIISEAQVVKIATRFYDRHYKQIFDAQEKMFVDQSIGKLDVPGADTYKIAQGLSSTAVVLTGSGQSVDIPLIYSAKAVMLFPRDTLIVNNLAPSCG